MSVVTQSISLQTQGRGDTVDVTNDLAGCVQSSGLTSGTVTVFCPGSTGGVTTIEFEPGVVHDLKQVFNEIAPPDRDYRHHLTWGDDNGNSHVRAGLLGPSLTIPFVDQTLTLGTWQQVVFIDFDTRPRSRSLVVQLMGE